MERKRGSVVVAGRDALLFFCDFCHSFLFRRSGSKDAAAAELATGVLGWDCLIEGGFSRVNGSIFFVVLDCCERDAS